MFPQSRRPFGLHDRGRSERRQPGPRSESTSIFQVFGHAEPSGDEAHNKELSDKRASAFHACLVGDFGALQALGEAEGWGVNEDQIMLRTLKCDPGPIDGKAEQLTGHATRLFQYEYLAGVFHRHLPDASPAEAVEPTGELDDTTRLALIEAYVLATSPRLGQEQLHPTHPMAGCSEYNLRDPENPSSNRRVALLVHPNLPPHHDAAPCAEGDHAVCPLDDQDSDSACLWYREHVEELAPSKYQHRHFDLRWLQLDNGAWLLSALTTLPDDAEITFEPFRLQPLSPEEEVTDEKLDVPLGKSAKGIIRGGVAQVVWKPEEGPEVAYPQLVFGEGDDPRSAQPKAVLATFRCTGGDVSALAPPPGRELVRLPNDADTEVTGSRGFLAVDVFGRVYQHGATEDARDEADHHPLRDDEPRIFAKRPLQMTLVPED